MCGSVLCVIVGIASLSACCIASVGLPMQSSMSSRVSPLFRCCEWLDKMFLYFVQSTFWKDFLGLIGIWMGFVDIFMHMAMWSLVVGGPVSM